MLQIDKQLMESEVLNVMNASDLWFIMDRLTKACKLMDTMIQLALKQKNLDDIKKHQGQLFYIMGNLSLVEDAFFAKTQNIFDSTEYSDICFN